MDPINAEDDSQRIVFVYVFIHYTYSTDTNCKIGVSYKPEAAKPYPQHGGWRFWKKYPMPSRSSAIKLKESAKRAFAKHKIHPEMFDFAPSILCSFIEGKI